MPRRAASVGACRLRRPPRFPRRPQPSRRPWRDACARRSCSRHPSSGCSPSDGSCSRSRSAPRRSPPAGSSPSCGRPSCWPGWCCSWWCSSDCGMPRRPVGRRSSCSPPHRVRGRGARDERAVPAVDGRLHRALGRAVADRSRRLHDLRRPRRAARPAAARGHGTHHRAHRHALHHRRGCACDRPRGAVPRRVLRHLDPGPAAHGSGRRAVRVDRRRDGGARGRCGRGRRAQPGARGAHHDGRRGRARRGHRPAVPGAAGEVRAAGGTGPAVDDDYVPCFGEGDPNCVGG